MKNIIKLLGSIRDLYSCIYFNFITHKYIRLIKMDKKDHSSLTFQAAYLIE